MYCGSCLRDNALAAELLARGHDVMLHAGLHADAAPTSATSAEPHVFFGGISVFLEQHVAALPPHAALARSAVGLAAGCIRLATKRQIKSIRRALGELTVSMLRGEDGFQRKEIDKLLEWLATEPRFDVINLPYTLLLGLAAPLRRALKVPICCTLQGEDLFLDGLGEPYRSSRSI